MASFPTPFPVDSEVKITSERHLNLYGEASGKVQSLTVIGLLPIAGIELPSGRFVWIPEHCLSAKT